MPRLKDKIYWENYYEKGKAPEEPSEFAEHVLGNYAKPGHRMIELGCGNGRDARHFAAQGVNVVAVDICDSEIATLREQNSQKDRLEYRAGDFTNLQDSEEPYDVIYSRFTLHSVNAEGQKRTLEWARRNLSEGGYLCIETRGQKNELFQKGNPVQGEEDAYVYEDHYRRFVEFSTFKRDIASIGFELVEAAEETGFAPFKDTDFHFIRVVAQ